MEYGYLDLVKLEAAAAPGLQAALAPLIEQWEATGLIRRRANAIVPQPAGWFWLSNLSDSLMQLTMHYLGGDAAGQPGIHHVQ